MQEDTAEDCHRLRMRWTCHFLWQGGYVGLQDVEGAEKEMESEEAIECERCLQFVMCGSSGSFTARGCTRRG